MKAHVVLLVLDHQRDSKSMLAAVYRGPNDIAIQHVPSFKNSNHTCVLKVNACAVCGYDVRVFRNGHPKVTPPVVLGHELCGELVQSVDAIDYGIIPAGSRVALCPLVRCLECSHCRNRDFNLCLKLTEIGSSHDGGFAEYVSVPKQTVKIGGVVPVPDSLRDEEAALLEPLACCLNSFSRVGRSAKDVPIVIVGDGPIGLMHLLLFKALLNARLAVVGKVPSRMQRAVSLGADAAIPYNDTDVDKTIREVYDFTGAAGAGIVIVAAGNSSALDLAAAVAGKNSTIDIFAGIPSAQKFQMDPGWLHYNQVAITGSFSATPETLRWATKIAGEGLVDLAEIVTHRYALSDFPAALATTENYYGLRAVINEF